MEEVKTSTKSEKSEAGSVFSLTNLKVRPASQTTNTNIVYLNTIAPADREILVYNKDSLKKRTFALRGIKDTLLTIINSDTPISSAFRKKVKEYLGKQVQTKDVENALKVLEKRANDNDYYQNYIPENKPFVERLLPLVRPAAPITINRQEVDEKIMELEMLKKQEEEREVERLNALGLTKGPEVIISPVVPSSGYDSNIGDYQNQLQQLFNAFDIDPVVQNRVYEYIDGDDQKIIKFIKDVNYSISQKKLSGEPLTEASLIAVFRNNAIPQPPALPPTASAPAPATTPVATTAAPTPAPTPAPAPPAEEEQVIPADVFKTQSVFVETGELKERYHPLELGYFLGSANNPEWDRNLMDSVMKSGLKPNEIEEKMKLILKASGDKLGITKIYSKTLEEYNELLQLQFCLFRNLQRGTRTKTASVKLSDLNTLISANAPNEPEPVAKGLITQGSPTIVKSLSETERDFQKTFNESLHDLSGRYIGPVGNINTSVKLTSGSISDSGRPSNVLSNSSVKTSSSKRLSGRD